MREFTERLFAVLEHKVSVLQALIDKQEALKQFLVTPDWQMFNEVTRPQEGLLRELQQAHAAQNVLLEQLLARRMTRGKPTLKQLSLYLEPPLCERLEALRVLLREKVETLRKLSRFAQRLAQAQWEFAQACLAKGSEALASAQRQATYSANGYRGSAMPQQLVAGVYGEA